MAKIGEMISTEEAKEIVAAVQSANDGVYFPLITVVACFGIIIVLLLYIWNQSQRANSKRHDENEKIISELVKSRQNDSLILNELKLITKFQEERIQKLES